VSRGKKGRRSTAKEKNLPSETTEKKEGGLPEGKGETTILRLIRKKGKRVEEKKCPHPKIKFEKEKKVRVGELLTLKPGKLTTFLPEGGKEKQEGEKGGKEVSSVF